MQLEVLDLQVLGVQRAHDFDELTDVVRALDADGIRIAHLTVHEPTLDDVFLAKTGRHLEGAGDEAEQEEQPAG